MNNKHIAVGIIAFLIFVLFWGSLEMRNRMNNMQKSAEGEKEKMNAAALSLRVEQNQLIELRNNSANLIEYLKLWQPYFDAVDSPQNAELKISLRVKEDNLLNLSQRYEVIAQKGNSSLPNIMRAYLTFEDDYARLLNWIGRMESQLPTLRIGNLRVSRGTGAGDVKMEVMFEQPLMVRSTTTSP